ncbi:MAG: CPBP family intramembrane glutamic endopeptidase [Terriglobales bacterium]
MDSSLPAAKTQLPSPQPQSSGYIAPWWHTVLLVAFMLVFSALGSGGHPNLTHAMRVKLYVSTIVLEWLMVLYVTWGIRKRITLRTLIGGRWNSVEDFLLDIATAVGFWIVAALVLAAIGLALGLASTAHLKEMQHRIGSVLPESGNEIVLWILLSFTAGFCEEVIYRGYLQKQLGTLLRSAWGGVMLQGLIFGCSHAYEGWQTMVQIGAFGILFGILAHWRKSLRPGMMAHLAHDTAQGLAARWILENASKALPK